MFHRITYSTATASKKVIMKVVMYYLWNDVLNLLEVSKVKLGEEKIKF